MNSINVHFVPVETRKGFSFIEIFSQNRATSSGPWEYGINFYQRGWVPSRLVQFDPEQYFKEGVIPLAWADRGAAGLTDGDYFSDHEEALNTFWTNFYKKFGKLWSDLTVEEKEARILLRMKENEQYFPTREDAIKSLSLPGKRYKV